MGQAVELVSRVQVTPEGFFDDDPRLSGNACGAQSLDDSFKERGRNCQIMGRMPGIAQCFFDGSERSRMAIVPTDITQLRKKLIQRILILDAPGSLKTVFHALMNKLLFLLHPLVPQIHHTIVIGFAFHQAQGGFDRHRVEQRFPIPDHQGMDQHIDAVPQVMFQK